MCNALSIDLEYWWSPELLRKHFSANKEDILTESLFSLLKLLDKHNTKATFFVLGKLAEEHPNLVKQLYDKGHEIASHGYSHTPLSALGEKKFNDELRKAKSLLKDYDPIGFRAPSFSINNQTKWAFDILEKCGFKYDSSIFPVKTSLYGLPNAPLHIYRPSNEDIRNHDPKRDIIEFPLSVMKIGKINIPIAGGFYLRFIPFWLLKRILRRVGRIRPLLLYIHPWETFPSVPKVENLPFLSRMITYYGINSTLQKLDTLLSEFKFQSIRKVLQHVEVNREEGE